MAESMEVSTNDLHEDIRTLKEEIKALREEMKNLREEARDCNIKYEPPRYVPYMNYSDIFLIISIMLFFMSCFFSIYVVLK